MRTLQYFLKKFKFFLQKGWKKRPEKLLRKTQIPFFTAWAAQTAQTEEFMLQNLA